MLYPMNYLDFNNSFSSPLLMGMGGFNDFSNPMNSLFAFQQMQQQEQLATYMQQMAQAQENKTLEQLASKAAKGNVNAKTVAEVPHTTLHDFANAGSTLPIGKEYQEKYATKYRRSEQFGELTSKPENVNLAADKVANIQGQKVNLESLEQRLKQAKEANKPKAEIKQLEKDLKLAQQKFDKDAKGLQKTLVEKNKPLYETAKLENEFYSKMKNLMDKDGKIINQKAFDKLMANKKYANFAKEFNKHPLTRNTFVNGKLTSSNNAISNFKALKSVGKGAKIAGRAAWFVALAVEGYDIYNVADKYGWASKQTAKKATSAAFGMAGAVGGAKLGASIGAGIGVWFGGVGAPIGAAIGGFIGGAIGYFAGSKGSEMAFDAVAGKTEYNV